MSWGVTPDPVVAKGSWPAHNALRTTLRLRNSLENAQTVLAKNAVLFATLTACANGHEPLDTTGSTTEH